MDTTTKRRQALRWWSELDFNIQVIATSLHESLQGRNPNTLTGREIELIWTILVNPENNLQHLYKKKSIEELYYPEGLE